MKPNVKNEKGRMAFMRFGLSGLLFTVLGPTLFWVAYPLGPLVAVAIAELNVHILRFLIFRTVVFPADKGYRVSLPRYAASALPVTIVSVAIVMLLSNRMERTELTVTGALLSLLIGFIWSRYVYTRPISNRRHAKELKSTANSSIR